MSHGLSDHFPIYRFILLQNIDAMLVLEACGSLVLYTGVTRVRLPVRNLSKTLKSEKKGYLCYILPLWSLRWARCLSPASYHPASSSPATFPISAHQLTTLARRLTLATGTSKGWMRWLLIVLFDSCPCEVLVLHSDYCPFFLPPAAGRHAVSSGRAEKFKR